jgi:transcription antitermination factor NusG
VVEAREYAQAVPCSLGCAEQSVTQWFALRVKSRFEKAVALAAHNKGFEEFLPLYQIRHEWSDRYKSVDLPLFPGYVFCRLEAQHRFPLLTIPGVMHVVGIGRIPSPIDDAEILAIQNVTRSQLQVEPWPFLEFGERVRLKAGPLNGIEGFLIQLQKPRVILNLPILRQAIAVEIERNWIEPSAGPETDNQFQSLISRISSS